MPVFETRAFVYHGAPGNVTTETLSFEAGPEDLVVEVIKCARCGTDKTIYRLGHKSVDPYAPVVLGHELVGRVVYVGNRVPALTEGIGYREGSTLSDAYLAFRIGERVTFQSRIARYRHGLMLITRPHRQSLVPDQRRVQPLHEGFRRHLSSPSPCCACRTMSPMKRPA